MTLKVSLNSQNKEKKEFSKIIVITETITRIIVIVFCFIMMWRTNDLTPFNVLIPMTEAVCGITYGYYFWKAKAENVIKMKKENGISINEKDIDGGENNG